MYVYVVGWHPATDSGANGGFEWRYSQHEAVQEAVRILANELTYPGEHNIVYAKLRVPFEVDPSRPREYDDREHEITEWIDKNLHLIELPEQTWTPEEQDAAARHSFRAVHPEAFE